MNRCNCLLDKLVKSICIDLKIYIKCDITFNMINNIIQLIVKQKFKNNIDYIIDENNIMKLSLITSIIIKYKYKYGLIRYLLNIYNEYYRIKNDNNKNNKYNYDILLHDILDDITLNKILEIKRLQMIIGKIWQYALGTYKGYKDLKIGHLSGLDIINEKKKMIFEIKNRTNTDNDSSRTNNRKKLAKYKKENPEYTCYYGFINEDTYIKTTNGNVKEIFFDGQQIIEISGYQLLNLILDKNTDLVIKFLRSIVNY